jgi:hypothetical protein
MQKKKQTGQEPCMNRGPQHIGIFNEQKESMTGEGNKDRHWEKKFGLWWDLNSDLAQSLAPIACS